MRLATIQLPGRTQAVRVDGEVATVIGGFGDVGQLLRQPDGLTQAALANGEELDFATARVASPILEPGKVLCVGMNYRGHIEEMGRAVPQYPTLFNKWASSLVGHRQAIALPPESSQVDWEGELCVVIGRPVRRATPQAAQAAMVGFTLMCDTSMRDWQYRTTQFLQGKVWDRSTPVGPWVVVGQDPPSNAQLTTTVNGTVMQQAPISDLLFGPVELVQYISTLTQLNPGDIIATGTPGGVGHARKPPQYLQPGDAVTVSVDGIGRLSNPVELETSQE